MTWASLDPRVRAIALEVLTPKQLEAYRFYEDGLTERVIAVKCKISRRAVRDRLSEADVKIHLHPDYPKEEAA